MRMRERLPSQRGRLSGRALYGHIYGPAASDMATGV